MTIRQAQEFIEAMINLKHAERGIAVDEKSGQPKLRLEKIKKANRMYRGQSFIDDD